MAEYISKLDLWEQVWEQAVQVAQYVPHRLPAYKSIVRCPTCGYGSMWHNLLSYAAFHGSAIHRYCDCEGGSYKHYCVWCQRCDEPWYEETGTWDTRDMPESWMEGD